MILNNNEYTFAVSVPENWSDFDTDRNAYQQQLEARFTKPESEAIMNIIESRWPDFAGETAIVINDIEGYKALTYVTDEFKPIECADKVFPFEGNRTFPMQFIEKKITFKRW